MALRKKVLNGFKWNAAAVFINTIIQLLRISVLARILDTSDFGLMAIALMVIGFTEIFSDLGFTVPIIHKQDISKKQISSVYWINIILSVLIYIVLYISAPIVANLYKDTQLTSIIRIIGIVVVINAFGKIFQTLKTKNLEFKFISLVNIITTIIGFFVTYILALYKFGVLSLVYGTIAQTLLRQVIYSVQGHSARIISFYISIREINDFIRIGANQVGAQILDFVASKVDVMILGRTVGMDNLGIYNLAKELIIKCYALGVSLTRNVMTAALAKLQTNINKFKLVYIKFARYFSLIFGPAFVIIFFFSYEISSAMYGEKDYLVAPVLKWLSLYGFFYALTNPMTSAQLALGRTDLSLLWTLVISVISALITTIASWHSFELVVISQVIIGIICFILSWFMILRKMVRLSFREYMSSYNFIILCSSISILIYIVFNSYMFIALKISIITIIYLIGLYYYERKRILKFLKILRKHFFV